MYKLTLNPLLGISMSSPRCQKGFWEGFTTRRFVSLFDHRVLGFRSKLWGWAVWVEGWREYVRCYSEPAATFRAEGPEPGTESWTIGCWRHTYRLLHAEKLRVIVKARRSNYDYIYIYHGPNHPWVIKAPLLWTLQRSLPCKEDDKDLRRWLGPAFRMQTPAWWSSLPPSGCKALLPATPQPLN